MTKFILGLVFLAGFQAAASGFQVKSAACNVQHDVNNPNLYDKYILNQDKSGTYSANLPEGVVATLTSVDSGFTLFWHTVSVQMGKLKVSTTGSTPKYLDPKDPIEATFVRTEGQIAGLQFYCDAEVDPTR